MRFRYFILVSLLIASTDAATITKEDLSPVFSALTVSVDKTAEIPESVMNELVMVTHDRSKRLANPKETYNSSDVVYASFPDRRLCFASRSPDNRYFLICYDHGAGLQVQCSVLFKSSDSFKSAFAVWAATIPYSHRCETSGELLKAIEQENVVPYTLTFGVF